MSLAIPIYKGFASLKGRMGVLLLSLLAGSLTSLLTTVGVQTSSALTVIFAISTGILGSVLIPDAVG